MTANGHFAVDERGPAGPLPGARTALILLLAINLFNYIDRQVLAAVEPEIRRELLPPGQVPDDEARFKMGLLSTAFLLTYMFTAPLFGWLADRMSRWALVGIGVILWSLASGASGVPWGVPLTAAFWMLLLTRCFVGVGEGAYGPIAPTMIADLYPVKDRGRVLAWFYVAIPVGGALGYTLGEVVLGFAEWRWAFIVVVPPGLLLGLLCFLMREPPRGLTDAPAVAPQREVSDDAIATTPGVVGKRTDAPTAVPPRRAGLRDYVALFRIPSYVLNTLGMTAMTFAIGALAFWMPDYLEQQGAGAGARTIFGAITATSGLIATIAGGIIGDWLRRRWSGSYFIVSGIAMMLGFPAILGFLYLPFPYAWIFVFVTVFCLFFNTGPTNTILANVTHPSVRASAFALNILIIHALGDAISPPVIGYIAGAVDAGNVWEIRGGIASPHYDFPKSGMTVGFLVVSVMMLVGGVLWLWGARYLERDTARALTSLAPDPEPQPPTGAPPR
jgi:MFS family permease